ncbi:alpha/beta hydrolase [Winogradskya consettensis]|uniref:Acetylhydrolase n=1 Tax=Winogradskya consettensis TaxID=113560 RepID=A0A919W159_9ACTN|nr:alpha/beta hydrolase [Actinoplanes consettensis]GIM85430.1 acetylhydrolase [Actinoplanes consettensis]
MQEIRDDVRVVLGYLEGSPGIETQEVAAARAGLIASAGPADLPYVPTPVVRDLNGPVPARLYDPREVAAAEAAEVTAAGAAEVTAAGPVVVWFHGGGFVTGGIETHQAFAADVARGLGLPVVLVDYRLAPEAPFPAAHDDAQAMARWVASGPAELGFEVDGLVLGGDSAGGTLAIATAMALRDEPAAVPVLAHLAIYPATDETDTAYPSRAEFAEGYLLTGAGRAWYRRHLRPDPEDLRSSPVRGELAGMPPGVVLTAGLDPVRDEGRAYAQALIGAGVPVTFLEAAGVIHAFVLMRKVLPSVREDLDRAFGALRAYL